MQETDIKETLSSPRGDVPAGRRRGRYVLLGGVVAAAATIAITAWVMRGDSEPTAQTYDDHRADAVAATFMVAGHAYELDRATGMLADDAELVGSADVDDWRADQAWNQAVGFTLADLSCREGESTSTGTAVRCVYALHGLGSEQLGRGPFGGGVADLTVLDGKIARVAENWPYLGNGFSSEMWEPVQAWVTQQHPRAAGILYGGDPGQTAAEHETELRLWRQMVAEYVASHQ